MFFLCHRVLKEKTEMAKTAFKAKPSASSEAECERQSTGKSQVPEIGKAWHR